VDYAVSSGSPGSRGDFAFSGLEAGAYWFSAVKSGTDYLQYGPVLRQINHGFSSRSVPLNLSSSECRVTGRVVDIATSPYNPLDNVRVVITPGSASESFRTTTDSGGRFVLDGVPEGVQTIMMMKRGYEAATFSRAIRRGVTDTIEWGLAPSAGESVTLSGTLTAMYDGLALPVSHVEVILGSGLARTFTDGDGRYVIHGLTPGAYFGTLRKVGYKSRALFSNDIRVLSNDTVNDAVMEFQETGPVLRAIVQANQTPVANARVTVLQPPLPFAAQATAASDSGIRVTADPIRTDAGGVCQIAGLPEGAHWLAIELQNGEIHTNQVYVYGTMATLVDLSEECTIPYTWRLHHFGTNSFGQSSDPDQDGFINLDEFIADTDPLDPASFPRVSGFGAQSSGMQHEVAIDNSSTGRQYHVEMCTDLIHGDWEACTDPRTGTGERLLFTVPNGINNAYYRIRIGVVD